MVWLCEDIIDELSEKYGRDLMRDFLIECAKDDGFVVSDEVTEMYQCTDCMYRMVEAEVDAEEAMKAIGLV